MYRIPEKQFRKSNGFELCQKLFLSVCKSPTQSLTFHRTEISFYHFSICFVSFYIILCKLSSFMRIYAFKRKKLRGNVVFTTTALCIYFASLTLICKLLLIRRISLEAKISILNSQMLAFLVSSHYKPRDGTPENCLFFQISSFILTMTGLVVR